MTELKSYFIRHNMDITEEATKELCRDNLISIHFTDYPFANTQEYLDPENYNTKTLPMLNGSEIRAAKRAIGIFRDLNKKGGYIWAEYSDQIKVGKVIVNSFRKIEKQRKKPSKVYTEEKSLLKTLKIEYKKTIEPEDAMSLKVCRPPFTTITEWKAVRNRLEYLIKGMPQPKEWGSLFDSEQESVCGEFLRENQKNSANLPVLKHLLLPIGRTMKDVDIYGITQENKKMFAQVTYKNEKNSTEKKDKLEDYEGEKVLFCKSSSEQIIHKKEGMWIVPLDIVEKWLLSNSQLADQLFSVKNK